MAGRKTVCLNMIVRNEAHVIRRCLESARGLIDRWCIVDTGSTDGTQDLIRDCLKDVPGELFERPWQSFEHNRTEAIRLARGDYLLFIDADDVFEYARDFKLPELTADAYLIAIDYGAMTYRRVSLINNALPWRYVGVLHEYLECASSWQSAFLDGLRMRIVGGGARSRVAEHEKYARDAAILEDALAKDPQNARYAFYLAQSYRDSSQPERALEAYDRRATMTGFDEEVFCALLEGGRLARRLRRSSGEIIERFLKAYEYRPRRAESLGELAMYLREEGNRWPLAYLFASRAKDIPMPDDLLFVGREWYRWRCLDEYAVAAYWVGEYDGCRTACEQLLTSDRLPSSQRERVIANLNFARQRLGLPPAER
ncbi:MAG TPA: glycosyltransferase [Nevskiaceae bacterium]|nr:glycosyltransferase [Nevskiaceae bacterium]